MDHVLYGSALFNDLNLKRVKLNTVWKYSVFNRSVEVTILVTET